mmetsp:Transcript_9319/g.19661  ORF Transcript_9319/g.19661 Transcript_9319/m.19661 type:complete len:284 (-) Transcript_9319:247-1098(-)
MRMGKRRRPSREWDTLPRSTIARTRRTRLLRRARTRRWMHRAPPLARRRRANSCGRTAVPGSGPPTTVSSTISRIPSGVSMPFPKSWTVRTLRIMLTPTLTPSFNCWRRRRSSLPRSTRRRIWREWRMTIAWMKWRRRRLRRFGIGSRSRGPTRNDPVDGIALPCHARSEAASRIVTTTVPSSRQVRSRSECRKWAWMHRKCWSEAGRGNGMHPGRRDVVLVTRRTPTWKMRVRRGPTRTWRMEEGRARAPSSDSARNESNLYDARSLRHAHIRGRENRPRWD